MTPKKIFFEKNQKKYQKTQKQKRKKKLQAKQV
jgi:hypothetical protein